MALRNRQTVFGGVHVVMSAQRDQGAEMAPRLSLRRCAVPDRAAQPTHSGGRERLLRVETQQPGAPTSDAACRSSRKRSLPFTAQVVHPEKSLCLLALRVAGIVGVSRRVITTRRGPRRMPGT